MLGQSRRASLPGLRSLALLGVLTLLTGLTGFVTTVFPIRRLGLTRRRGLALRVGSVVAFLVLVVFSSPTSNAGTTGGDSPREPTGPQVCVFATDQSGTPGAANVERQITFNRLPTAAELDRAAFSARRRHAHDNVSAPFRADRRGDQRLPQQGDRSSRSGRMDRHAAT